MCPNFREKNTILYIYIICIYICIYIITMWNISCPFAWQIMMIFRMHGKMELLPRKQFYISWVERSTHFKPAGIWVGARQGISFQQWRGKGPVMIYSVKGMCSLNSHSLDMLFPFDNQINCDTIGLGHGGGEEEELSTQYRNKAQSARMTGSTHWRSCHL